MNHIMANMHNNKHWKGFDDNINLAARCPRKSDHEKALKNLKKQCPDAEAYLTGENLPRECWARSHFDPSTKCENVTNNITESFNKWILKARDMPIVNAVMYIQDLWMTTRWERKRDSADWDDEDCVPRVKEWVVDVCEKKLHPWKVRGADGIKWNVVGDWTSYLVDLKEMTCNCQQWDHTGIPCVHAIAVLVNKTNKERIPWGK